MTETNVKTTPAATAGASVVETKIVKAKRIWPRLWRNWCRERAAEGDETGAPGGGGGRLTGEMVQGWFRDAGKGRLPLPSIEACTELGGRLMSFPSRVGIRRAPPPLGEAAKYARLLLVHLPKAQENIRRVLGVP